MHLITGLGNPGARYQGTRHNVGFMVIDRLGERLAAGGFRAKFNAELGNAQLDGRDLLLLKPMTYMNLSGEPVRRALHFFKLALETLVVVHDELDLEFGTLRIKSGGGTAGHKGLASIVSHAGGANFVRVRIGIGRPRLGNVEDYVLSDFSAGERAKLPDVLDRAVQALECVVQRGARTAMNRFNTRNPATG